MMSKQNPPKDQTNTTPENKFKQMKMAKEGVSMEAPPKKTLTKDELNKPKVKSKDTPFIDGKEGTISEKITEKIKVDIRNRKEQFYDGEAKTVSSVNDTGEFDVLPKHANFVTLIRGYIIVDKGLPTEKKFEVDNGVLAAKTGAVDVYLDF